MNYHFPLVQADFIRICHSGHRTRSHYLHDWNLVVMLQLDWAPFADASGMITFSKTTYIFRRRVACDDRVNRKNCRSRLRAW
jgi:hypothetical protein